MRRTERTGSPRVAWCGRNGRSTHDCVCLVALGATAAALICLLTNPPAFYLQRPLHSFHDQRALHEPLDDASSLSDLTARISTLKRMQRQPLLCL